MESAAKQKEEKSKFRKFLDIFSKKEAAEQPNLLTGQKKE
jgi:hypothetical protein